MHHFEQNGSQNPILSLIEDAKFLPLLKLFCFSGWLVAISLEMGCCWYHFMLSQNLIFYINDFFLRRIINEMVSVFQYFELFVVIVYCESGNSEGCCHGDSPIKSGRFAAGSCRPAFFCKPSFTVFILHLIIFYTTSVLYVQMHLAKLRLLYSIFLYISFL